MKIEAEEAKSRVNKRVFNEENVRISNEEYMDWKVMWRKLKNIIKGSTA